MKNALLVGAAAALVAAVSATSYDYNYHYYPTEAPKKCYSNGERCLGAYNHPAVEYLPCCGESTCTKKDTSYGGYGYVCEEAPKCYGVGVKCIGAPGYPAVPYRGCCGKATCSKAAEDWGYVCAELEPVVTVPVTTYAPKCVTKGGDCADDKHACCDKLVCAKSPAKYGYGYKYECAHPPTKAPTKAPTTTTASMPKCRPAGEKCAGAPGYPAVDWIKCCDGYRCVGQAADWGRVCAKPAPSTMPATTSAPPAPKCVKKGGVCSSDKKCCDKLACTKYPVQYGYGYKYECAYPPTKAPTKAPTTTASTPKCRPAGEKCAGAPGYPAVDWVKCCDGYRCVGEAADWGRVCAKPAPPAPKCVKKGSECGGSKKCCGDLVCGENSADYGYTYECQDAASMALPGSDAEKCMKPGAKCSHDSPCCGGLHCKWTEYENSHHCVHDVIGGDLLEVLDV